MSCELIIELWENIKPHINAKERLHVADTIVNLFDEYGFADGLESEHGLDKTLQAAVASRFIDPMEDEHDDIDG